MKTRVLFNFLHEMRARNRLFICLAIALLTYVFTKNETPKLFQFIYVWISFAMACIILLWLTITTAQPHEIRRIAAKQDSSRPVLFLFVIVSSFVSLFAVVLLLKVLPAEKHEGHYLHIVFAAVSVIVSWILIHSVFIFRYAHLYYNNDKKGKRTADKKEGGLSFPNDTEPDYLDFAYFSFVIGMTFQVSDVEVTSSDFRRIVLLHGLLSFMYNTVIVALSINIISGLIQK